MEKTLSLLRVLATLSTQGCTKDPIDIALPGNETDTPVNADDTAGSNIETDKDDDNVANTTFARTVKVAFSGGGATVTGATADFTVVTDGAGVTITNNGSEAVIYELSGTSTDGYFKLYSTKKQEILLNGLTLTNKKGAAINNQSHKRTFVVVKGTNTLADGASYTQTPSDEDEKAAFFSEGQLVFSGDGTLTVNATGKAGITSDDYVRFMAAPTVKVTSSAGHGVRGKESIIVSDGTVDVNVSGTGKKGFSSDTLVYIGGGVTTIKTSGSAGEVDGELTGVAGIKADLRFEMVDGVLNVTSTGTGAKGISGDNVAYFKGGTVTVDVSGANYGTSSSGGGFGPGGHGGWPGGPGGGQGSSSSSDNSVASKGIKFDGNLYISGGKVTAKSEKHEAIEAKGVIQVTGGEVYQLGKGVSDSLNEMNSRLTKDIRNTGSRAAALAGLHPLPYIPSKPTNFAASIGSYRGDTAVAVGLSHYVNENTMFSVGSTIGHQPMVNVGVALRLGRGEETLPTGRNEKAQSNRMARMEQNFESYKQEKEAEIAELRRRLDQIQGVPAVKKTTAQSASAPDSVDAKLEKLIERRRARKAAQTVKR